MACLMRPWGHMQFRDTGGAGDALVFANSLGTDSRMWDEVIDALPGRRCITFDKRGHGLSATPGAPWRVEDLADDLRALMDARGVGRAVIVGCSIGGIIAQALAVAHPGLVRGLVLSNTAAKVGTPEAWQARIDAVRAGGLASIAGAVLERWFAPGFLASDAVRPWRQMLLGCDAAGYAGTCAALAQADLRAHVGAIAAPVLMIAGSADQATPPDLVAETAAAIPGARLVVLEGSGHIPAIDAPDAVARAIADFLETIA
ncbi:MAG TPA: 3-oxoadipate enol-lactonase [Paracoccaceae bacterium]|nr:3-oxoadipate enol-lactonase [Paracoccaceae bacterium]